MKSSLIIAAVALLVLVLVYLLTGGLGPTPFG